VVKLSTTRGTYGVQFRNCVSTLGRAEEQQHINCSHEYVELFTVCVVAVEQNRPHTNTHRLKVSCMHICAYYVASVIVAMNVIGY